MRRLHVVLLLVLLSAAAAGTWFGLRGGDSVERRIGKRLDTLAGALSKAENESAALGLLKLKTIAGSFADPVTVVIGAAEFSGVFNGEAVMSHAARYRAMFKTVKITVSGVTVTPEDGARARVVFAGTFSGIDKSGQHHREVNDLVSEWREIDGSWRICDIRFEKVLHP